MGTLKVDTIQDSGGNTILSSDGSGGFSNSLPAGKTSNFRNFIINGDMSIAQRGTSASGLSGGGGLDTVDRFRRYINLAGTWTNTQSTDVPTGQGFANSWKWDCTTANASIGSTAEFSVSQRFEGQMLQQLKKGTSNAESLTVSFWVKSNKTGTYICEIFDGGNSRHIGKAYTINSANTWEKKTITFEGDTTGTISNNNTTGLQLNWWLVAGTYWTSGTLQTSWGTRTDANRVVGQVNLADSTSNEWYITGVQLEVGTTASDFEFLPHDVNFQRCARYFQQTRETSDRLSFSGKANGDTTIDFGFPLVVPLRNTPTASQSGTEWRAWRPTSNLAQSSATFTVQAWVENNPWVALRVGSFPSSSFTNNYLVGIGPSNLYINLDAEL